MDPEIADLDLAVVREEDLASRQVAVRIPPPRGQVAEEEPGAVKGLGDLDADEEREVGGNLLPARGVRLDEARERHALHELRHRVRLPLVDAELEGLDHVGVTHDPGPPDGLADSLYDALALLGGDDVEELERHHAPDAPRPLHHRAIHGGVAPLPDALADGD